jgi:hypothetical protein
MIENLQFKSKLTRYHVYLILIFIFSLIILFLYNWLGFQDFYDDSYHHYYISKGILENSLIYTDFKSNQYLWLPGFHYFGSLILLISGSNSIIVLEFVNRILGSIVVILVADITFKVCKNYFLSLFSAFLVMFSPWFIIFSNLNMPENFLMITLLLMIKGWYDEKHYLIYIGWIIGFVSRYEVWFFGLVFFFGILIFDKRTKIKFLSFYSIILFIQWIILWCLWNYFGTGDYFHWFFSQINTVSWDIIFEAYNLNYFLIFELYLSWFGYIIPLISFLFYSLIYILFEKYGNDEEIDSNFPWITYYKFLKVIFLIVIVRIGAVIGLSLIPYNFPRFIIVDLIIIVLLVPSLLFVAEIAKINIKKLNLKYSNIVKIKNIFASTLLLVIIFNFIIQIPILEGQDYTLTPSKQTGIFLKNINDKEDNLNFKILIDSPTIAYYADLSLNQMIPSSKFRIQDPLAELRKLNIDLIVLQNVSYSEVYFRFPFLNTNPDNYSSLNGVYFEKIYEYDGWELNYGVKPIFIYKVIYL